MKHFAILACGVLAASSLLADTWDKKTVLTINETIMVPGKTLPPGKYVMMLANSASNRNIVQIFNEDQSELQATILAFNNSRSRPAEGTVLEYWETPAGSPPALRAWFYPGDLTGQEFAYPKEMAERLARENNNAKVASYEGNEALTPETAAQIDVHDQPQQTAQTTAQQPQLSERNQTPAPVNQRPAEPQSVATSPAPQDNARNREENTVLAQNTPQPRPVTPTEAGPNPVQDPIGEVDELPRTASPVPLVLLGALTLLGSAAALRRMRRA